MDDALLAAYRHTDYRVRLAAGGHASIRIGQPLPALLGALLADAAEGWLLITAWNPASRPQPRAMNRLAQRDLCAALRAAGARCLHASVGVGASGWREPSLFAIGPSAAAAEVLMRRFGQNAVVRGVGTGPAQLAFNRDCDPPSHGHAAN